MQSSTSPSLASAHVFQTLASKHRLIHVVQAKREPDDITPNHQSSLSSAEDAARLLCPSERVHGTELPFIRRKTIVRMREREREQQNIQQTVVLSPRLHINTVIIHPIQTNNRLQNKRAYVPILALSLSLSPPFFWL